MDEGVAPEIVDGPEHHTRGANFGLFAPTDATEVNNLNEVITMQPTAGFDEDGLPYCPADQDVTDEIIDFDEPVRVIGAGEVPTPAPIVELPPAAQDHEKGCDREACGECLEAAFGAFVVFLMVLLFVPLVVLHFATHIVHRITGGLGDGCLSISYTQYHARDDRIADETRSMQSAEDCAYCFTHTIGYVLATVSWVVWLVSKTSLMVVAAINEALFGIEWLATYAENYDGATLPTCETGGTEHVNVHAI
eukprot:m.469893 g.469893  ORF g.469893 m.469893 type:complete len:250 (-) comp29207_c0_seq1:50-799(-)